jgi:hypothetical protein
MRVIDISALASRLPANWERDAREALEAVRAAAPEDRSNLIQKHSGLWRSLKDLLREMSYMKCWYCESIDCRSDNAVDHYRPKANVRDARPPHEGYWWLAFDWRNYRFACCYCNSIRYSARGTLGGKQDYFPLFDESRRARAEADDLAEELPMLLDPTMALDPPLLWFRDDGMAGAWHSADARPLDHCRAETSARLYHLNHPDILERRLARCLEIRRWVAEADSYLDRLSQGKAQLRAPVSRRLDDIRRALAETEPYSAAVRCTLMGMREASLTAELALR